MCASFTRKPLQPEAAGAIVDAIEKAEASTIRMASLIGMTLYPDGEQLVVSKADFEARYDMWEQHMLIAIAFAREADKLLTALANEEQEIDWPTLMVAMTLGVHAEEMFLKAGLIKFGHPMTGHHLDDLYREWRPRAEGVGLDYEMRFVGSGALPAFHFRYMTDTLGGSYQVGDIEPLREYLRNGDMHDAFERVYSKLAALT